MNAQIVRLFGLVVLLFALLVVFTSRWTVFEAKSLRDNPANRRALLEEARIERGRVKAADGTVLARSVRAQGDTWRRVYPPEGGLFSQTVGYAFTNLGRAGIEQDRNDELTGHKAEFSSIIDELRGKPREGDDVLTSLDIRAQRVALQGLAGRPGAVVALDPSTGRVRVMASVPGFDQNVVPRAFRSLSHQQGSPLLNRVTQAGYPPGSTFKVVTAIAALDSGRYTPQSLVAGNSPKVISGVPLRNDANENFGTIDLTTALTHSVNTVWAEVGEKLGKRTMAAYMTGLGFYAKPPIDYPAPQRVASGEYSHGSLLSPLSSAIDVGRMAIGQDKLAVTPLQMAMVAAAVANGGELMQPLLAEKVVDRDGRVVEDVKPKSMGRVMKPETASAVGAMMTNVVREGTGTAAALSGIDVAGKTGTAEIVPGSGINQVWFIAFAPVQRPRVAIAVTVERSPGFGGTVAAPIAKQVLETLLR